MEGGIRHVDVAIVGGGIAGLCVAYELTKRSSGASWALFEASDRLGGKVLSEQIEHEGGYFIVEGGPDAFLTQKPWARHLAEELGLTDRLVPINSVSHPAAILKGGRPIDLPDGVSLIAPTKLGPFLRSTLLSPLGKARAGLDLVLPRMQGDVDESVGSFVRRRLGPEALDWLAEPLVAGIYNADPDQLSLRATFPQFRAIEREHGSLIRGLRAARAKAGATPKSPAFMALRDGMQELVDALVGRVGMQAYTNVAVQSIQARAGGGYELMLCDGRVILADSVVLAIAASEAATLVEGCAPAAASALRRFRANAAGTISLAFRSAEVRRPLTGYGLIIPHRERSPINAVTVASAKFAGRAPKGWTLLRVFFGGARSPQTMELDDERLLAVVREQLQALIGIEAAPAFHRIHRWPAGSPQYDVGHLDLVAQIEAALPPGLWVAGSPYRGVGIPDIVQSAGKIAGAVAERHLNSNHFALR